jgi:DNA-binding transcriptional LysR family regulator
MRALLEEFDSLEAAIKDAAQEPSGRLRITAPLTFGAMALTQVLSDFARAYPRIALDVNFSDRIVNLVDEGFDIAIRIGRPDDSAMIARKLCDMRLLVVAAPEFMAQSSTPATPEALGAMASIIDTNFREPNRWPFRNTRGEAFSAPVQGRLRFSNAEACLNAAEAGLGLACVPSFVAADALRAGRVVRVLQAFEAEPLALYALYPHSRHLAAKLRRLVDFLAERFKGKPAWDEGW